MDLHGEIEKVAYELYERDGRKHGKDREHWLEAERLVKARHAQAETSTLAKSGPAQAATSAAAKKEPVKVKKPAKPVKRTPAKKPAK